VLSLPVLDLLLQDRVIDFDQNGSLWMFRVIWHPAGEHPFLLDLVADHRDIGREATRDLRFDRRDRTRLRAGVQPSARSAATAATATATACALRHSWPRARLRRVQRRATTHPCT